MSIINKDILDQVSERESIIRKEQNDKNKEFIKSILCSILDCYDEANDILDTFNYMRSNGLIDIIPDHIYYVKSKTSLYCPYTIREGGYHKFIYSQINICGGPISYHDTKIEIIYIPKFGELIINYDDNIFKYTIHIKSIYKYNNDVKFECDLNRNKRAFTDDDFIRSLNNFKMNFKQMLNEMKNKLNNIK